MKIVETGRLLPVAALGVGALFSWPLAMPQAPGVEHEPEDRPEIVITGTRDADEAVTAQVEKAMNDDRYLYVGHIKVTTENGVVRLQGVAQDAHDLIQTLRIAKRAAGGRRIVNEIELLAVTEDNDF